MSRPSGLGAEFARAIAVKDFARVRELVHPDLDFVGMTPRRTWEAHDPQALVDDVLAKWFEPSDELEELERLATDTVADREHVAYRLRGRNGSGPFVVEQQAYLAERDGRIGWMRVLCSGFRPV